MYAIMRARAKKSRSFQEMAKFACMLSLCALRAEPSERKTDAKNMNVPQVEENGKTSAPQPIKATLYYLLMLLVILAAVELINQVLFFALHGQPVWSWAKVEQFNIRSFTRPVNDARFVTMKPNVSTKIDEGWGIRPWSLSTDMWGFRKGTHSTKPDCMNIVFLGASVPFGWGVPDTASLPSKVFDDLLEAHDPSCVVNAAVPSYSLFQSVARYEHEIRGKIRTRALFLQIYDPVSQVLLLGPRWNPQANWTTERTFAISNSLARWSASFAILRMAFPRLAQNTLNSGVEVLSLEDKETFERFRHAVHQELEHLHEMLRADGVHQLILGSLAVPNHARNAPWFSAARRFVIDMQNEEFRQFAAVHRDVVYADTAALLNKFPDDEVFIDDCCHLTEHGNTLVAQYIVGLLDWQTRGLKPFPLTGTSKPVQ